MKNTKSLFAVLLLASALLSCKKTDDYEPLYDTPVFTNQNSTTSLRLTGIHFLNENVGYVAGLSGTILKTTNAGQSWEKKNIGTARNLQSVSFADENTGWVSGATGTVFKTIDGGNYWFAQTIPTTQSMNGIKFVDNSNGWMVGGQGFIFNTTDGGENWVRQNNFDTTGLRAATGRSIANTTFNFIYALNATTLFICGNNGLFFKTSDGGATWKWQKTGNTNALYSIHFPSPNLAYICGANGTILKTDGLGNFENATAETNTRSFRAVYFSSNNAGWAAGEHGYIFHTNNAGAYWGNETFTESTYILYACAFPKTDVGYFVGNNGTILKVQDIKRN